jgi:hypothetical protein
VKRRRQAQTARPIRVSPEHQAAASRRRRIMDQCDAMDVLLLLTADLPAWLRFAFNHADTPGSQIDAICWDVGMAEDTYSIYDSTILPRLDLPPLQRYRDRGLDWVGELVTGCHQRGLDAFWNARISEVDMPQPWTDRCGHTDERRRNPLKAAHPDWVLPCWWWLGLWNLASPALREHKVRVLRELVTLYDFDGIQLDFARHTPCLPLGRQWRLRHHATAFVRQVREMLLAVACAKGRPILLAARVPENLPGCRQDGLDVVCWAQEKLLDILVLGSRTTTVDIEGFRQATAGSGVRLCPTFDRHHTTDGYYDAPIEYLRGVYANWWRQGADSVATFNWPCASAEVHAQLALPVWVNPGQYTTAIREIGSYDTLRGKEMVFTVERRGGYPWSDGYHNRNDDRPLPCLLANHGVPATLPLPIHEDLAAESASVGGITLRLVLWSAFLTDEIEVRLNGHRLECSLRDPEWKDAQITSDKPQCTAGARLAYVVDPGQKLLCQEYRARPEQFRAGENEIALRVLRRGPHLCGGRGTCIEVEKAEVWVTRRRDVQPCP